MRKSLAVSSLVLALALPTAAEAQFSVGLKGGLTFATLSADDLSPDFKNQTGFAAGFHLAIGTGVFGFQPEALLTQQGAKIQDGTDEGSLKVSYLVVPANLRVNIPSVGVRPYLIGGPYAAFKLSCDVEDLLDDCDDLDLNGTDWGLNFGGGLVFGQRGFFVEARYALGLKDISNVSSGFEPKNRVFMVMAGITF
jgi:hypothetical protein